MNALFSKIESLAEHVKEYLNSNIELIKLKTAEKSSAVLSNIIAAAVVACILFFFLVFASIAVALILSNWIGKMYAGFLIVAGFYLLTGTIIWMNKERMIRIPIMNKIIQQLFKDEHGNDKGV